MEVPAWLIIAVLGCRFFLGWVIDKPISSTADTPLVEIFEAALPSDIFAELRGAVLDRPDGLAWSRHADSNRLNGAFGNSRGFVLRFNAEGAEEAFRGVLAPLRGFWETSRRAGDNAFVLNLLHIAQQPDCEQRAPAAAQRRTKASLFELLDDDLDELAAAAADADVADADDDAAEGAQQRQYAVGLHVDETVGIDSARLFLAHAVSVLYLDVDERATGGELELFEPQVVYASSGKASQLGRGTLVAPLANRLAVFRGDAYHRVTAYCGERPRVSLVLEAYRIEPKHYAATTRFELLDLDHRKYERSTATLLATALKFSGGGVQMQLLHGALLTLPALFIAWLVAKHQNNNKSRNNETDDGDLANAAANNAAQPEQPDVPKHKKKSRRAD